MNDAQPALRVIVVDGYPVVRWGVRRFLERQDGVEVLAEASTVSEAKELLSRHHPDVAILDLMLLDTESADELRDLLRVTNRRLLAFTAHDGWQSVEEFLAAGGLGFVSKRAPINDLAEALRAVADGRQWISPSIRRVAQTNADDPAQDLTPREREVAVLIARGSTSKQIADQLCVTIKTVESHRYRIFKKLGIRRSAQLVDYVIKSGLAGGTREIGG